MSIFSLTKDAFGLDIGSSSIKVVQLKANIEKPFLVTYGSASIPLGFSQSDSDIDVKRLAEIIKHLVKGTNVNTKNVYVSIPEHQVFSLIVTLPQMPHSELDSAVKWQAAKNLPIKIEDVKLGWQIINSPKSNSDPYFIMIIAAPIDRVRKIVKLIKAADLNLVSIETSTVATSRSIANFPGANIMVIDIGAVSTEMSLVINKVLMYSRSVSIGGEFLTKSVSKGLGLDLNQAEQFKRKFGLTLDKLEGRVYKSLKPVMAMIVDETQRSMEYISKQYGLKVDLIILGGGTAKLPEINSFFEQTFNIKSQIANPWENISYPAGVQQDIMFSAPDYSVAVGLALREGK